MRPCFVERWRPRGLWGRRLHPRTLAFGSVGSQNEHFRPGSACSGSSRRRSARAPRAAVSELLVCVLVLGACSAPTPARSPEAAPVAAGSSRAAEAVAPGPSLESSATGVERINDETAQRTTGPRPPDFELDTLDGGSFRLSEHLGSSVVLIDFWATYCDPCLAAMPHLNELYQEHKQRGLVVVGVSIDGPESVAQVRSTVQKLGVEFPVALDDDSSVVAKYNPKLSAPFSVLIGRDGSVITKAEGYTTGRAAALDADVERALAKTP